MLILTRRAGETLMIGDDVSITVLGVKGNQVRIGVNAPKNVSVHREEIYQRIQREKTNQGIGGSNAQAEFEDDSDNIGNRIQMPLSPEADQPINDQQ